MATEYRPAPKAEVGGMNIDPGDRNSHVKANTDSIQRWIQADGIQT